MQRRDEPLAATTAPLTAFLARFRCAAPSARTLKPLTRAEAACLHADAVASASPPNRAERNGGRGRWGLGRTRPSPLSFVAPPFACTIECPQWGWKGACALVLCRPLLLSPPALFLRAAAGLVPSCGLCLYMGVHRRLCLSAVSSRRNVSRARPLGVLRTPLCFRARSSLTLVVSPVVRFTHVGSSAPSASTVGGAGHCRRPHVSHSVLLHTYRRMSVTSHVRSLVCCAPSPAKQRPFG